MLDFAGADLPVDVRFLVERRNNEFVPEPEPLVDSGLSYRRVRGQVEIRSVSRARWAPEDELVPLVTNLCFRAVMSLVSDWHAVIGRTDSYGYVRLDREADAVRISGDGLPDDRVAAEPLMRGLVDCGARFRLWLRQCSLQGEVERLDLDLAELESEARQALATPR